MKILLYIVGGLLVVGVIAFFVIAFSLGSIVKGGVNRYGPQYTQAKVELGSAQISPFSGKGTLSNLVVGNPPGWEGDHAFSLGEISLDVEPKSLTSDHVVVNSIVIRNPEIVYQTNLANSNLQDLMKNIQQATGGKNAGQKDEGPQKKIEVKSFRLEGAKITAMAAGNVVNLDMPPLVMENLGTREGGLTPQQLTVAIMKEVTAQAIQAAGRVAVEKGLLDQGLKKLFGGDKAKNSNAPAGAK